MTKKILIGLIVLVAVSLAPAGAASASVQWDAKFTWGPTQLHPGETALFTVSVRNRGTTPNTGSIKVVDHLPLGVKFKEPFSLEGWACSSSGTATTLTCTRNIQLTPLRGTPRLQFFVEVDPLASGTHDNTVIMSGAGSETVTTSTRSNRQTTLSASATSPRASTATHIRWIAPGRRFRHRRAGIPSSSEPTSISTRCSESVKKASIQKKKQKLRTPSRSTGYGPSRRSSRAA